jgi:phospholipid/cholesterol/gamma-HCH transport system substrate-binding protein
MEYRRTEIRAGVFLLISFTILAVIVFTVSDIQNLFKQSEDVRVLFLYSDGIEKNAPVRFAGIRVGKVTSVRVATELGDKVELTLSVFKDTVIKEDTKAAIRTLGLVGGKYVELAGGSPIAPLLKPGGVLIGHESMKLEDLTRTALDVIARLKKIAINLDRVLGDPAMAKSLKSIIQNLQETTANIKVMTSNKDDVAQGLKSLPDIMKKLDESSTNLKAITEKTDKLIGENRENIDIMIENFKDMSKNLKETSDDVKINPWKVLRKP